MELVFATNNEHKIIEVQKLMPSSIKIVSLKDINCFDEIEETATTLLGNAKLKADYISNKYKVNCFADDTGLEVEALSGAPGVFSARYAGVSCIAEDNVKKLLEELIGKTNRNAQFRTVIALNLNNEQFIFDGICKGEILKQKKGDNGFGYDPIFKPVGFKESFAQMSLQTKSKISHRGKAMAQLVAFLNIQKFN